MWKLPLKPIPSSDQAACWKHLRLKLKVSRAALTSMLPPRGYAWCSSQHLLLLPESLLCSCPPSLWISPSFSPSFPFFIFKLSSDMPFSRKKLLPLKPTHTPSSQICSALSRLPILVSTLVTVSLHYDYLYPWHLIQNCEPLESLRLV